MHVNERGGVARRPVRARGRARRGGRLRYASRVNTYLLPTLRLLAGDDYRSGEEIAARLGVTRATVWNAMQEAEQLGLTVHKVRGRGYRLEHPPVWLDTARIGELLGPLGARFAIEVHPALDSTNTLMLERVGAGAPDGTVIAAEWQHGGRGRRGRTWWSGLGGALTFSLLWRTERGAAALSGASLMVGTACARALRAVGAERVGVKWPNDLLHGGAKVGGILIELSGDALGPSAVVIGIGINVRLPEAVRARVDQPVTDLAACGGHEDRNVLLATLLRELAEGIDRFQAHGFADLEPEFRRLHVLQDVEVTVALPDGARVSGRVAGTDGDGALLLDTAEGRRRFHGGEVSVRAT